MAMIGVSIGLALVAIGLIVEAVKGLRGLPDKKGKVTDKKVAVILLVLAVCLLVFAGAAPFLFKI